MIERAHFRRCLAVFAAGAVLAAGLAPMAATAAPRPDDTAELLAGLSSDQRRALEAMNTLEVDPLNFEQETLTSAEAVDVIVGFTQQPARVDRLLAAADGVAVSEEAAKKRVADSHRRFKDDLAELFVDDAGASTPPAITVEYTEAFNGAKVTVPGDQIEKLLESDAVQSVWPDAEVTALGSRTTATAATASATASDVQGDIAAGIAQLHADGITGEGVKIGVLDTGIDYNHPDLKTAYRGGYDFVDGDADPMETTWEDWKASKQAEVSNGSTYYTQHGTHVAGIIAGTGETAGSAQGVAPDAEIYSYRVLGPYGSGATGGILAAMDRALTDGMDVVNMSLGASINDPLTPQGMAANNLVLAGVTTVVAAGNNGSESYTLGSPAASALPITVGANDSPIDLAAFTATMGAAEVTGRLLAKAYGGEVEALDGATLSVFDGGLGNSAGYAGDTPTGKVALVRRGDITLNQKVEYAKQRGAVAVLLVNQDGTTGHIPSYLGESKKFVPSFSVTAEQGASLYAALAAGTATVTFAADGTLSMGDGSLASFSSRGPVSGTVAIKPEITAPGVSVLSSIPVDIVDPEGGDYTHAYASLSGTSMATPYVSGVAALSLQYDDARTPEDIKVALMNTAAAPPVDSSVWEVGAGQVDPLAAVTDDSSAAVLGITDLELPDRTVVEHPTRTGVVDFGAVMAGEGAKRSATIELTDAQKEKYAVKVRFTRGSGSSSDAAANGITLTANKSEVKATGSKVSLELAVPAAAAEGFYEGAVDFTAGDDVISVPFGLKIGDAGIDVDMVKSVLTNRQGQDMSVVGEATNGQASFAINLAGQLDHMDIVFADEDGNDLGVVGTLDTKTLLEDRWYGYVNVLGQYYPFTGDAGDPIASKPVWAAQGAYTLRLIGYDVDGNTVQATRPIYVDTTSPTYEDGLSAYSMAHPKVVEIPADAKEYVMKASLVDGELEAIRAHGIDISQAENRLYFTRFTSNPEGLWYPDANGDVNGTVTLSPGPSTNVRMWAADAAGNIATRQEVMLVRQGYPYVIGDADAATARPGDVVSYTFTAHDTQAWADYAMDLRYSPTFTEVLSVEKTDELGALASGEITTSERTVSGQVIRRVGVTFDDQAAGVTRDELATFKVTFKVLQPPVAQQVGLYLSGVYAKSLAGGKQAQVVYPGTTYLAPTSTLTVQAAAQGLLTESNAFDPARDYSQVGTRVELTLPGGAPQMLGVDARSTATATDLAYSDEFAHVKVTTPGHMAWYKDVDLATHGEFGLAGQAVGFLPAMLAGDVNGDDVIDVKDAIAIYEARGTADRAADVDLSGTVDADDLQWVVTNWFARNATADSTPVPVAKHQGQTLNKIVAQMP